MLSYDDLDDDQELAVERLFAFEYTLLYAGMGAGKTVIALTAIQELIDDGYLKRVLVVAPLSVCKSVWATEHTQWTHLQGLHVEVACGDVLARARAVNRFQALSGGVLVVNFECLGWLFKTYRNLAWDGLVIDELSRIKSANTTTFKLLRSRLSQFKWRVGMTGTPVSENWQGLYSQLMAVDGGASFGKNKDRFLREYFYPTDYNEYTWELKKGSAERMTELIAPYIHTVADYRDTLPECTRLTVDVELPIEAKRVYTQLARDFIVEAGESEIVAENAAVLTGKLQQLANGFLYDGNDNAEFLSFEKIALLSDVVACLIEGPVVIVYWFSEDLRRLKLEFPDARVLKAGKDFTDTVDDWNAAEIDVLLLHPKSAGHGLNLGPGGSNMIFVGPIWSRDLTTQTIARIWRRGQERPVYVYTLVATGTVDEAIMARVEEKKGHEDLLKKCLQV